MHANLEKRFIRLAAASSSFAVNVAAFKIRYCLLFAALAEHLGITAKTLAKRVGFDPMPDGGNATTRGEAEPSNEDVFKLLDIYLEGEGI